MTVIKLVPEIKGCYGPRVWVSAADEDACNVLRVLSVWPNYTDTRSRDNNSERCYELPFGFIHTGLWHAFITRMDILVRLDGED